MGVGCDGVVVGVCCMEWVGGKGCGGDESYAVALGKRVRFAGSGLGCGWDGRG